MTTTLCPPDAALFERYAQLRFDLHALAKETGLGLVRLIDWAMSPPIQALLDDLEFLAHRAARLAALRARPAAVHALGRAAQEADHPRERRLAAAALDRATKPEKAPRTRPAAPPAPVEPAIARSADAAPPPLVDATPPDEPLDSGPNLSLKLTERAPPSASAQDVPAAPDAGPGATERHAA